MALNNEKYEFSTNAIHSGEEPDYRNGAAGDVVVPIHLSTTFARKELELPEGGYEYTRSLNPTRKALETKLASLEHGKYGLAFSSGLAAETTTLLSLLKPGDHVVASDDLYGGTKRLFTKIFSEYKVELSYVDTSNPENIRPFIRPNTRLVWIESPTNPLLKLSDIKAIKELIREAQNLFLVVDNTFLSPYFQHPLDLGADIVLHSSTKYIGGHSDVLGGAVVVSDEALYEKLQYYQNAVGAVLSPFDSYLTIRGIKTLEIRMERHYQNALLIAGFLQEHPRVKSVIYPGLPSHPQYELAQRQTTGAGGVITFELEGTIEDARKFFRSLKLIALAESLGGVESLIELPAFMTHSSLPEESRRAIGISDTLIRLSVGIENPRDLIQDLKNSLDNL